MREATRANVAEFGVSVWLDGTLDVLWERVSRRSHRPLLQKPNPKDVLRALLEERNPTYALADIRVETRDAPHEVIVREMALALETFLEEKHTQTEQAEASSS